MTSLEQDRHDAALWREHVRRHGLKSNARVYTVRLFCGRWEVGPGAPWRVVLDLTDGLPAEAAAARLDQLLRSLLRVAEIPPANHGAHFLQLSDERDRPVLRWAVSTPEGR